MIEARGQSAHLPLSGRPRRVQRSAVASRRGGRRARSRAPDGGSRTGAQARDGQGVQLVHAGDVGGEGGGVGGSRGIERRVACVRGIEDDQRRARASGMAYGGEVSAVAHPVSPPRASMAANPSRGTKSFMTMTHRTRSRVFTGPRRERGRRADWTTRPRARILPVGIRTRKLSAARLGGRVTGSSGARHRGVTPRAQAPRHASQLEIRHPGVSHAST